MDRATTGRHRGPKVLRVGIMHNGHHVEERLFHKQQSVSVGQTPKQTFCIPVANVPEAWTLFHLKKGRYVLNITSTMTGRIALGDGVHTLDSLRKSSKAKRDDRERVCITLNDSSRGRVVLGEVTVLFQFVVPPPPKPKPQLPASVRGGWLRGMDTRFALILAVSAFVQGGAVYWVENTDWPEPHSVSAIPDHFAQVLVPRPLDKPDDDPKVLVQQDEEDKHGPSTKEKVENRVVRQSKPKHKVSRVSDPDREAAKLAARKRALAETVENETILRKISVFGDGDASNAFDALVGGVDRKSLESAFAGATGVSVASSEVERSGLRRRASRKGDGMGTRMEIEELRVQTDRAHRGVDTGTKRNSPRVQVRVRPQGPTVVVGSVDRNAVSRVINRRRGALVGCYERELKKDPNLKGKITVRFTIGAAGRVTASSIAQNTLTSQAVGRCVAHRIEGWRFPKPDGGPVSVSKSFVFAPGH